VLTIELGAQDLGRIRFAAGPAPLLEAVLMLYELRHRPQGARGGPRGGGDDWRPLARMTFASAGRPLLQLAPGRQRAYYLDVLTPDADEAFHLVQATPEPVHRDNVDRISRLNVAPVPEWLRRYTDGDPATLSELDRALRAFHAACLAPRWPQLTARFHHDLAQRTALSRRHGVLAMLSTLSPDLRLHGMTLEGRYPWDRRVRLQGRGLTLMPSTFWCGHPLITWDPQDSTRYVLIYPARLAPDQAFQPGAGPNAAAEPLAMLLGTTRARVLRALRQPHTTTTLAADMGISPSSASAHATVLRGAGLITSERLGQAVVHQISELGWALLWHD
jgi:DNA-binding transcriptional ArsR family regulator